MRRWAFLFLLLLCGVSFAADVRFHIFPDTTSTAAFCGPWNGAANITAGGADYEDSSGVVYFYPNNEWFVMDQERIGVWTSCTNDPVTTTNYSCLVGNDNEGITTVSKTSDDVFVQSENGNGFCRVSGAAIHGGTVSTIESWTWTTGGTGGCGSAPTGPNTEGFTFVPDPSIAATYKWGGYFLVGTQDGRGLWKYGVKVSDNTLDCLGILTTTACNSDSNTSGLEYDYDNRLLYILNNPGNAVCAVNALGLASSYTILNTSVVHPSLSTEGFCIGPSGQIALVSDVSDGNTATNGLWIFKDPSRRQLSSDPWPYTYWNWQERRKITIKGSDNTEFPGTTDLTDFPLLISFTDSTLINEFRTDAFDIVFTDAAGTQLDHDLNSFDSTTGNLSAWVRMPTLSTTADTNIYMYFNNPSQSSTMEAEAATWASKFLAVYHLDGADTTPDDANGGSAMSETGDPTENATAKVGTGVTVVRGSSILTTPLLASYNIDTTDLSICAWFNMSSFPAAAADAHVMSHGSGGAVLNERFYWREEGDGARLASRVGTTNPTDDNYTTSLSTWYRACIVHNSDGGAGGTDSYSAYQNGTVFTNVNNITESGVFTSHAVADWTFGGAVHATDGFGEGMNGTLDEIWIRNVNVTSDEIAIEYRNQNTPANTVTYGSIELRPRRAVN